VDEQNPEPADEPVCRHAGEELSKPDRDNPRRAISKTVTCGGHDRAEDERDRESYLEYRPAPDMQILEHHDLKDAYYRHSDGGGRRHPGGVPDRQPHPARCRKLLGDLAYCKCAVAQ